MLLLCMVVTSPAWADIYLTSVSAPATVTTPLNGFSISYKMNGTSLIATAQVNFYLSDTPDGSTGVWPLFQRQVPLSRGANFLYYPPGPIQSAYVSRSSMHPNTVAMLEALAADCVAQRFYLLWRVDYGVSSGSSNIVVGANGAPDFYFIAGTLTPGTIAQGGTSNLTFDVYTKCPAPVASKVRIYLMDAAYQVLGVIGDVNISAGAGTSRFPSTGIQFSPVLPAGQYYVALAADADNVVLESNENNNVGAIPLQITAALAAGKAATSSELIPDMATPVETGRVDSPVRLLGPGEALPLQVE
jgi:hypothetical protein